jgi:hypothetical protein
MPRTEKMKRGHLDESSSISDGSYRRRRGSRKETKKRRKRLSASKRRRRRSRSDSSSCSDSESRKRSFKRKRRNRKQEKSDRPSKDENPLNKAGVAEKLHDLDNMGTGKIEGVSAKDMDEENTKMAAARQMVPMTREQYEAEQSKVREVYDPDSGRMRLVRGSGEIIERIVSREAHQQINRQATRGDGESFSRSVHIASTRRY